MRRLAIRCQARDPVLAQYVEQWLEQDVQRLRGEVPEAILRLHRITGTEPTGDNGVGWLIELDATEGDPLDPDRVDGMLRDLRLLGLRPTLLSTLASGDFPVPPAARKS